VRTDLWRLRLRRLLHALTCDHPLCVRGLGVWDPVSGQHISHRVQEADLFSSLLTRH